MVGYARLEGFALAVAHDAVDVTQQVVVGRLFAARLGHGQRRANGAQPAAQHLVQLVSRRFVVVSHITLDATRAAPRPSDSSRRRLVR